jgi:cytochrome oxidase assembly protein ShyY1
MFRRLWFGRAAIGSVLARASSGTPPKGSSTGRSRTLGMVLFGIPVAITFSLGVWQSQRLKWKLALIDDVNRNMKSTPLTAAELLADDEHKYQYRPVALRGRFLHDLELQLGPRAPVQPGGSAGFFVLTPFQLENRSCVCAFRNMERWTDCGVKQTRQ